MKNDFKNNGYGFINPENYNENITNSKTEDDVIIPEQVEIGRITPRQIAVPRSEAYKYTQEYKDSIKNQELAKNYHYSKITSFIPLIIFVIMFAFALLIDSPISTYVAIASIALFAIFYFRQLKIAMGLARTGRRLYAKQAMIASFISLLGSINVAVMKILNSDTFNNIFGTSISALGSFRQILNSIIPQYGDIIFFGLMTIIIIGLNGIAIKAFRKAMRLAKIFSR